MSSRKIAIAGSIAALAFAAAPVAAAAAPTHASAATRDNSRDIRGVPHVDRAPDQSAVDRSADRSSDTRDR